MSSGVADAVVELDHHLDDLDQVLLGQDPLDLGDLQAEPAVDLVAADLAEVVAAEVEEQRVDQVARVLDRRRVARAQAPVELEQRVVGALGRVLGERLADEAVVAGVDLGEQREDLLVAWRSRSRAAGS